MKISFSKKVLSLCLAAVLLISTCIPAFAVAEPNAQKNPILIITGFSAYPHQDANGKMVFPIKQPVILEAVKQALPSLLALLDSPRNKIHYDAFYRQAIPIVNDLFDPTACNPDGSVKHEDVTLMYQYPESVAYYGKDSEAYRNAFDNPLYEAAMDAVGMDNVFIYGLDWRIDPFLLADEIHEWVQHIKAVTGSKKVSIAGISMGGMVLSTYIAKYGVADVSNITMISSAFTGVAYIGELFKGNMSFNQHDLLVTLDKAIGIDVLAKTLGSAQLVKDVIGLVDEFLYYEKDNLYRDFVLPAFGQNIGMWAFVPNEDLKEAKAYMFNHYLGTPTEKAVLNAKIDACQLVQKNIASTFARAQKKGANLAIISNYNLPMLPICPDSALTGDKVIETKHTSGGATAANYQKTLPKDTKQSKYLSSDRMIDASTCMFPDCTWFIKNMQHVAFSKTENQAKFYVDVMTANHQLTIDENPNYPQFMCYDTQSEILYPLDLCLGDIDQNGFVNLVDARKVLRYLHEKEALTSVQKQAADMDESKKITIEDVRRIMKSTMELEFRLDALRDQLIAAGVPEEKIPHNLPSQPGFLPPELRDALENLKLPSPKK